MRNAEMDIVLFNRNDVITTSLEEEEEECIFGAVGM